MPCCHTTIFYRGNLVKNRSMATIKIIINEKAYNVLRYVKAGLHPCTEQRKGCECI